MHVAIVGGDLLGRTRIRDAAERLGAVVTVHPGPEIPAADLVVVDLEFVDPDALGPRPPSARVVGIYPHKDTGLAARAERLGIEPVPRSHFATHAQEVLRGPSG
jgi:hypothetical protein